MEDLRQAFLTVGVERLTVEDRCRLLPVGAMRPHAERKYIPIVCILLVDAMRPRAEIVVIPPMLVGAMHPHAWGKTALTRLRARFLFGLRMSFLHLSHRRLESAGGVSMICCHGQDRMLSLVVKVELKVLPEMSLLVSPLVYTRAQQ